MVGYRARTPRSALAAHAPVPPRPDPPPHPTLPYPITHPPSACLLPAALSFVLHLDVHLGDIISRYGRATYALLFGIVFCETGLGAA